MLKLHYQKIILHKIKKINGLQMKNQENYLICLELNIMLFYRLLKVLIRITQLLNCRIKGLVNKSPNLIILDRFLNIKKNLNIFKLKSKRNIILITLINNKNKIKWLKSKKVKVFIIKKLNSKEDFILLFKSFSKLNFSRIFIESGLTFINFLIKNKFLNNIYIFKSNFL